MPDIVVIIHGPTTRGVKRYITGRLCRAEAVRLRDQLDEALAQEEFEDADLPAQYVHANAVIATGTVGTEVVGNGLARRTGQGGVPLRAR